MKRSPLLRRKPLRARKRRAKPGDDPAYLAFVRTLSCCCWGIGTACGGRIEASHVTTALNMRGVSLKMPDRYAVPHCSKHHREWETRSGAFRGLSRWVRMQIASNWVSQVQAWYCARRAA